MSDILGHLAISTQVLEYFQAAELEYDADSCSKSLWLLMLVGAEEKSSALLNKRNDDSHRSNVVVSYKWDTTWFPKKSTPMGVMSIVGARIIIVLLSSRPRPLNA